MIAKANILIAENEGIIAKDIERILIKFGYAVSAIVFNVEEAIQKAEENKPDLVLIEISIGGETDGIEAARSIYTKFNIPVVFITAVSDGDTIERAKIAEPYGFIVKPFEDELLYATIEMALYRYRMNKNRIADVKNKLSMNDKIGGYKTSQAGLREDWTRATFIDWTRATFIVRKEHLEKIKALAYWERKKVKEVVEEALEYHLKEKAVYSITRKTGKE
jgi:AmiR/NasT family two-component response regulator